jgi:hypothetical protein
MVTARLHHDAAHFQTSVYRSLASMAALSVAETLAMEKKARPAVLLSCGDAA